MTLQYETVLTDRERQILTLAASGLTSQEIGRQVKLSDSTVKVYLERARRSLGARNTAHAVAVAIRTGVIE